MKLLDWIKGAVGFTKAPSVRQVAKPTPQVPVPIDSDAELSPAPPQSISSDSARPVEQDTERPPQADSEALITAKAPEPPSSPSPAPARSRASSDALSGGGKGEPAPPAEPPVSLRAAAAGPPSQDEIERRRALVRRFFNDYWSSIQDKPASFAERLDGAEGYINERVAAGGEPWQLDPATRKQLGLPPPRKR